MISRATVAGAIRLGVPPPKKMVSSRRGPVSARIAAISRVSIAAQAAWSIRSRLTWLLKSQ